MRERISAGALSAGAHVLLVMGLALPPTGPAPRMPAPHRAATVVTAPTEDATYPGLNPVSPAEDAPHFAPGRTRLEFNEASFDISPIAERYQVLFPFLTPGLSLDLFALTPQDDFDTFLNSLSRGAGTRNADAATPLVLSAGDMRHLIDKTWSRRDRWTAIQPLLKLADRHDPNVGDLPKAFRSYGEEDMGQYYADRHDDARDPRLWTELALAAEHVNLIAFIRRYAGAHPSTRTTTELLFILDKVIEGNRNILSTLRSTVPAYHLNDTRTLAPDAYAVILRIQRYYDDVLKARHLLTPEAVSAAYDEVRLKVLSGIVNTTPQSYRASDALFLMGWIHWQAGHIPEALAAWCQMTPGTTDQYSDVASAVLSEVRNSGPPSVACGTGPLPSRAFRGIETLLKHEDSRTWNLQYERLRRFGYSVDTFSRSATASPPP